MQGWLVLVAWLSPAPSALAAITIEATPIASFTYQLDCVSNVVPMCGGRHAFHELWRDVLSIDPRDDARVIRWRELRNGHAGSRGAAVRPYTSERDRVRRAGLAAGTLDEYERHVALLTSAEAARELTSVLENLWPAFDAWWRGEARATLARQVQALNEALAAPQMREEIAAIEAFYDVPRGAGPFVVHAVYRPVAPGATTAQVFEDVAVAEVPANDSLVRRLPVVVHEYAHSLLARLDPAKLAALRAAVVEAGGRAGPGAWRQFDETLATAVGNGRVTRRLAGAAEWKRYVQSDLSFYDRDDLDRAAKAVLPLVDTFMRDRRSIVSASFAEEYVVVVKRALGARLQSPAASFDDGVLSAR